MALGGGIFVTQGTKTLPGAYINFVSAARASAILSDRGLAAMPLMLDWGVDGEVFTVTNEDFFKNTKKIFGYDYAHEKMKGMRDLFKKCKTLYAYKLTSGGAKATNEFAEAKYTGIRGNALKIVVTEVESKFEVKTYLDTGLIDVQTVATAAELVDNDFVVFKKEAVLTETAGTPLTSGENGTVDASSWQDALDALEAYSFNVFGAVTTDDTIKELVVGWTKQLRDEQGIKFQVVVHQLDADDKAVISVENGLKGVAEESAELVYWVTGAEASCEVNASLTNSVYDGEYEVDVKYTQAQLTQAIKDGKFMFHKVGDDVRVLTDINTKVTVTVDEGEIFKKNQCIRVVDQIANDIAVLFNTKYLGIIPNDAQGRISLWNDIVKHHDQLNQIRAIEGYVPEDTSVMQGDTKDSVVVSDAVTVTNAMEKLFMTCVVA